MKFENLRLVKFKRSSWFFAILLILILTNCDKRKPKYTQVAGETFEAAPIKAVDLIGEYLVFIFMSPECPLSENYSKTINELSTEYVDKNVRFYIVFPGIFYPRPQIEVFIEKYHLPTEMVIYDPDHLFKDYFSATITPEAFLTDVTGTILYKGGIDNWAITLGKQRQVITEYYVVDAVESALKNESIKTKKTRAVGCIIE